MIYQQLADISVFTVLRSGPMSLFEKRADGRWYIADEVEPEMLVRESTVPDPIMPEVLEQLRVASPRVYGERDVIELPTALVQRLGARLLWAERETSELFMRQQDARRKLEGMRQRATYAERVQEEQMREIERLRGVLEAIGIAEVLARSRMRRDEDESRQRAGDRLIDVE